jgi:hypothetical protein
LYRGHLVPEFRRHHRGASHRHCFGHLPQRVCPSGKDGAVYPAGHQQPGRCPIGRLRPLRSGLFRGHPRYGGEHCRRCTYPWCDVPAGNHRFHRGSAQIRSRYLS